MRGHKYVVTLIIMSERDSSINEGSQGMFLW